jgi:hypothetical protein
VGEIGWLNGFGVTFTINPTVNGQQTILTMNDLSAPYNRTKIASVTASDESDTQVASATLSVYATFPLQPQFGYETDLDNKTLVSVAEDGSAVFRKKGGAKRSWQLQFPRRPQSEYVVLRDFWQYHEKTIEFYYYDLPLSEIKLVRFDSGLRVSPENMNLISMSCVLREV